MQSSDTTKELTLALCQFQSAQLKATKANTNPHFKAKYAGINEVLTAVLPTLTEVGLCFVQFPDGDALTTRLMHVSGEWLQASYALNPVQNTPQACGSALTYARRYALLSVLGLGTDDDDGQAASTAPTLPQQCAAATGQMKLARSLAELKDIWSTLPRAVADALANEKEAAKARIEAAIAEAAGTPL